MNALPPSAPADGAPALLGLARTGLGAPSSAEAMLWDELDLDDPDDRRFGDYELLQRIGRGGMGVVFRAHQVSLGRDVAVKFIVGSLADNAVAVARFLAEARAVARLHHPHIVPVFEVGRVEGMVFYSMPLLRGQTLAQRIAAQPMTPAECVDLLLKLGAAMDYAHSLGLLHLDLKPANVLFDEHSQPLIGDFGLARQMDDGGGVDAQEVSGTPAYMAPEQVAVGTTRHGPQRLDRRTDLYALGAILYELLTGVVPHGHGDATSQMRRATSGNPTPPRSLDATIDADLQAICLTCLRLDPQQRYADVADLMADLARYRDGNVVSVRQPGWAERVRRSLRRHPAIALATATALAAVLVGLAGTSWQWQRAERERAEADRQQTLATAQAMRMRQLAGLMAAAFPTGESARNERTGSARAAVAWLKQHTNGDPATQRAVLTSFREALTAAGKADAVAALLSEIVDQLGVEYRDQQVQRLAQLGDRDSLIAAALIGSPRDALSVASATHADVLARLFRTYPDDPLALYVAALACHVQPGPCTHAQYRARLVAQFPDNAVHWVLAPRGAGSTDADIAANVVHAARAKNFDDRLGPMTAMLRGALGDHALPDSILQPMQAVLEQSEVAPSLRRNAVNRVMLPIYGDIVRVCRPASIDALAVAGLREACGAFARNGLRSADASILARMISSAILRRLYPGTPLEAQARQARREYVWLSQQVRPEEHSVDAGGEADQLQQDVIRFGEWEAWRRQALRQGVSPTPPAGWLPSDPRVLMLPEEREGQGSAK